MNIEIDTEKLREQIEILKGIDKQINLTCASIMLDTDDLRVNEYWKSKTATDVYESMDDFDTILKEYSKCMNTVIDYLSDTVSLAYEVNQEDTNQLVDSNIDITVGDNPNDTVKVDGYDTNKEYDVTTVKKL